VTATTAFYHATDLAWSSAEDNRRFKKILLIVTVIMLLLSLIVPIIPVSDPALNQIKQIPDRYARLLLEKKPAPKPKPPQTARKSSTVKQKKPLKKKQVKKHLPESVAKNPAPDLRAQARERAARSGLLAFSNDLASLRQNSALHHVKNRTVKRSANGPAKKTRRNILVNQALKSSNGVDSSKLSRETGRHRLNGQHKTLRIHRAIAAGQRDAAAVGGAHDGRKKRSDRSIQLVFERNKGKLFRLYNLALRRDPSLKGKVVVKLTIAPDGSVSQCRVISSELNNPQLERRIITRIRMFNFGVMQAASTEVTYPIDFFPG